MLYLDLDETLIHSLSGRPGLGNSKRTKVTVGVKENGKPDTYHTQKRPDTEYILSQCRSLGQVKMFTNATKAYAIEMDKIFGLGFGEDIIAREDYLMDVQIAYGWDTLVTQVDIDKGGILIDNNPNTALQALLKMKTLGIHVDNYFQIREYIGGKDPDKFKIELENIFNTIRAKISNPDSIIRHGNASYSNLK